MNTWDEIAKEEEKAIQRAATKIKSGEWTMEDAFGVFIDIAPNFLPNKFQHNDLLMHMRVALRLKKRLKEVLQ